MKTNKNNYPTYPSTPNFIQERNFLENKKKHRQTVRNAVLYSSGSRDAQVTVVHCYWIVFANQYSPDSDTVL